MILTEKGSIGGYFGMSTELDIALKAIADGWLLEKATGRYELANGVYALVQQYDTVPPAGSLYEAHKKYIDVQYVVSGKERIGYAPVDSMRVVSTYDEAGDCMMLTGKGCLLDMSAGSIAIFFPCDAHLPKADPEGQTACPVHKVVLKLPV